MSTCVSSAKTYITRLVVVAVVACNFKRKYVKKCISYQAASFMRGTLMASSQKLPDKVRPTRLTLTILSTLLSVSCFTGAIP